MSVKVDQFQAAEGLEAGKSHVRHKDVDMGLVQSIVLSPDLGDVGSSSGAREWHEQ